MGDFLRGMLNSVSLLHSAYADENPEEKNKLISKSVSIQLALHVHSREISQKPVTQFTRRQSSRLEYRTSRQEDDNWPNTIMRKLIYRGNSIYLFFLLDQLNCLRIIWRFFSVGAVQIETQCVLFAESAKTKSGKWIRFGDEGNDGLATEEMRR